MKTISSVAAALALSIAFGGPALAQGRSQHERGAEQGASDQRGQSEQRRAFRNDDRQVRRVERREERSDQRFDRRHERRDDRFDSRQSSRHDAQGRPFYGPRPPQYSAPPRVVYGNGHGWRGAGPNHNFYRGGRLPPQYRGQYYVVDNWHAHRLSPPPRGYHWVQTGPDYVLAAIATGVILQIFLGG
ncbi:MAG: RcnB family protein [Ideonella sp.]